MHELYELKEMLCKELEEYGKKGDLSAGSLEVVDKLAHTVKNLGKIIEMADDSEYSGYGGGSYENNGGSYRRSYRGSGSYAYARGRGRNARRDSMGRYSSEGYSRAMNDVTEKLYELMEEAPEMKQEIQKFITKIENM